MGRPWRIQYAGAGYHLMSRGIEGRSIFRGEPDFRKFLELLAEARERFHLELYFFALLANHFHLVLRTLAPNVSRMMQWLQSVYVSHFNRRHKRRGHLLQARFKGIVIEDNSYLRTLSAYVHFNPVRAGMVDDPAKYPWTSYADYVGKRKRFGWIRRDMLLGEFGRTVEEQRTRYRKWLFSVQGHEADFLQTLRYGVILGEEAFVEWVRQKFGLPQQEGVPQKRWARNEGIIERVVEEVAREYRLSASDLTEDLGRRHSKLPRDAAIYLLWRRGGVRNAEVGKRFGVGPAAVTEAGKRLQTRMARNADLASQVARLEQRLDTVKPRGEKP